MHNYFNKEIIIKFYRTLDFTDFMSITDERRNELDKLITRYSFYFKSQSIGPLSLMTLVAERLVTSYKSFGLSNGDEKAYFFIKLIDPELQHLAVYESANKIPQIKEYCMKNFRIYDKYLIHLEKCYNQRFQDYEPDELWGRDNIKR